MHNLMPYLFAALFAPLVWSLIQGLQICKIRFYKLCIIAMVHLKLVNVFVEKQVMLPATLTDIEIEILCCKNILFAKIT